MPTSTALSSTEWKPQLRCCPWRWGAGGFKPLHLPSVQCALSGASDAEAEARGDAEWDELADANTTANSAPQLDEAAN